eukprot:5658293-Prymnesium_polylepis.2
MSIPLNESAELLTVALRGAGGVCPKRTGPPAKGFPAVQADGCLSEGARGAAAPGSVADTLFVSKILHSMTP